MPNKGRSLHEESAELQRTQRAGETLQGCLIGADPEQAKQEGRVRRRALVVSTLLQAVVVLAVVAIPFFGKVERIALANITPMPPYQPYSGNAHARPTPQGPRTEVHRAFCLLCPLNQPQPRPVDGNGRTTTVTEEPQIIDYGPVGGGEPCIAGGCINLGRSEGPKPPPPPATPKIVHVTRIDPALLVERIEPIYPILPKQMHREGRVELHAIISEDGTIESLEVMSGDALFIQSALDAVRRWRYRATRLNGQTVKVDTYITVVYTLQH